MEATYGATGVSVPIENNQRFNSKNFQYVFEKVKEIDQIFAQTKESIQKDSRWMYGLGAAGWVCVLSAYGTAVYTAINDPTTHNDAQNTMLTSGQLATLSSFLLGIAIGRSSTLNKIPMDQLNQLKTYLSWMAPEAKTESRVII